MCVLFCPFLIKALGETRQAQARGALLTLLRQTNAGPIHSVVIDALGYFDDSQIASVVAQQYPTLYSTAQGRAIELLSGRPESALVMLESIESKTIPPQAVSLVHVRAMREMTDPPIAALTVTQWGKVQATTPLLMRGRVSAVQQILGKGKGDAARGQQLFKTLCANCHKLHGVGESIGPICPLSNERIAISWW